MNKMSATKPEVFIEPEHYDAFLTILWEGMRPGWLIFQTDLWKLSLYVGKERRAVRAAHGLSNIQYRKKVPYRRLHPAYVEVISVVRVRNALGELGSAMVYPYWDAANTGDAKRLMNDHKSYQEVERLRAWHEPYSSIENGEERTRQMLIDAHQVVRSLNQEHQ